MEVSTDVISVKLPQMENIPLTNPIHIAFANRLVSYNQSTGFARRYKLRKIAQIELIFGINSEEISQAGNCKTRLETQMA